MTAILRGGRTNGKPDARAVRFIHAPLPSGGKGDFARRGSGGAANTSLRLQLQEEFQEQRQHMHRYMHPASMWMPIAIVRILRNGRCAGKRCTEEFREAELRMELRRPSTFYWHCIL
nr:hypothetical protein CFP56_71597 [Quercus suber]